MKVRAHLFGSPLSFTTRLQIRTRDRSDLGKDGCAMPTKRFVISFLAGALLGLPVTAASADKPATATDARAAGQNAREQADHYRQLGGVGYKTGLVQRNEAAAMRYDAMAGDLAPTPAATEQQADIAQQEKLEAHYKSLGAVTYKTGIEQRAEVKQVAAE